MAGRIFAMLLISLISVLAYQAEPISATIGWIFVAFLTLAFFASFWRKRS